MNGILIYTKEEAERNAFAINKIIKGTGAKLVTPGYNKNSDFVINRTDDYLVGKRFEEKGIRVFNPSEFSRISNDKQLCYDFMGKNGVEILPTRYKEIPFVKKPKNSHGGQDVKMCFSNDEYDENFVCQKPASDLGKDLRVYVLGGKIITAFLRQSSSDFRANFCLGARAVKYRLNTQEEKEVKKIISLVKGDYYGIDFLFNNGKIVFNELEDAVGARMVYAKSDIDILSLYCDYINSQLNKKYPAQP